MRRQLLLRLSLLVTAAVFSFPLGTAGQAFLMGVPAADAGASCDSTLTLTPGGSNPNVLADGLKGVAYDDAILTVTDGPGLFYYWELTSGNLPPGMFISITDTGNTVSIYGTPTTPGQYDFTVAVRDWVSHPNWPLSCPVGDTETYRITVEGSGRVTIALATLPRTGVDVAFQGDLGSFTLDNDPAGAPGSKRTFIVPARDYGVVQSDPAGWGYQLTRIVCTSDQVRDLPTRTLSLDVQDGDDVTCTFTNVYRRVDLQIAKLPGGPFKGDNVYATNATAAQTQMRSGVPLGTYDYWVRIANDGPGSDRFRVQGTAVNSPKFVVAYFYHGINVTTAVKQGTWQTPAVSPGKLVTLDVRVVEQPGVAAVGASTVTVTAKSAGRPDQVDVVRAITTR